MPSAETFGRQNGNRVRIRKPMETAVSAACLESQEVRGGVLPVRRGLLPRDALALMHADAVLADASWMLGGVPCGWQM